MHEIIAKDFISTITQTLVKDYILHQKRYLPYEQLKIFASDGRNVIFSKNAAEQCDIFSLYVDDNSQAVTIELPIPYKLLDKCNRILTKTKHMHEDDPLDSVDFITNKVSRLQELYVALEYLRAPIGIQDRILEKILYLLNHPSELNNTIASQFSQVPRQNKFLLKCIQGYCREKIRQSNGLSGFLLMKRDLIWHDRSLSSDGVCDYSECKEFTFNVSWDRKRYYLTIINEDYGEIFNGYFNDRRSKSISINASNGMFTINLAYPATFKGRSTIVYKHATMTFNYLNYFEEALDAERDDKYVDTLLQYYKFHNYSWDLTKAMNTYIDYEEC